VEGKSGIWEERNGRKEKRMVGREGLGTEGGIWTPETQDK
jgi:hypothetical protein